MGPALQRLYWPVILLGELVKTGFNGRLGPLGHTAVGFLVGRQPVQKSSLGKYWWNRCRFATSEKRRIYNEPRERLEKGEYNGTFLQYVNCFEYNR